MPQLLLHLSLNLNLNLVRQRLRFRQRLWIELQLQRRNKVFQHLQNKRTKLFGLLPFQESISFIQKHEIVDTHSKNGEKFRQINYLVFSNFFSKTVTFTKLLPKKCYTKFPKFPPVLCHSTVSQCGNYGNSLTHCWQKFRASNGFTK